MLDAEGNIDTKRLENELREALDADIKYRQTDNMKKKACKVATSYDEFKSMVQCSHLKTLSRKEVESLKDIKRGWVRERAANTQDSAQILASEKENAILTKSKTELHVKTKPKTPLELERDWRHLTDSPSKVAYLSNVGSKKVCSLLEKDGNAELFESILQFIVSLDDNSIGGLSENFTSLNKYEWLKRYSSMKGFSMLIMFVPRDLRENSSQILETFRNLHEDIDKLKFAYK